VGGGAFLGFFEANKEADKASRLADRPVSFLFDLVLVGEK
jgi:hypothetical protein